MAGKNQHYIPRFLLRAFGIRPPRREVWYFGLDKAPERRPIKRTASGEFFYSEPTFDGRATLDDAITRVESDMAAALNRIRGLPPGSVVAPSIAATIVSHLAQRTAHVRATLSEGVARLLEHAEKTFVEDDAFETLMGLDNGVPTDRFQTVAMDELAKSPEIARLGLPSRVLERTVFILAKEYSDKLAKITRAMIDGLQARSTEMVSNSHRKGLGEAIGSTDYKDFLRTFDWRVETAPKPGAILPDCVVVAIGPEGKAGNHLLLERDTLRALVLAVSPEKLLVGCKTGFALPRDFDFNVEAACLSNDFFLTPRNDKQTARLHTMIGQKLRPALVEVVDRSFRDVVCDSLNRVAKKVAPDTGAAGWRPTTGGRYELSLNCRGGERATTRVRDAVIALVGELAEAMPLERLDGITIGSDYSALLQAVQRGWENAPQPKTAPPEVGVGVAQVVTVRRSDLVKGRIVASSIVSDALISADADERAWATHILVRQLANVALMEIVEECLPGTLLEPAGDGIDGWLYATVDGAPEGYAASWMAGAFGNHESRAADLRELLASGIDRIMTEVPRERLAYREHGDLERLLNVALPTIQHVLRVAADLLGHCAFAGESPLGRSTMLNDALHRAKLRSWFLVYGDDLARFHRRFRRWESFDEFLAFNIHVERLLLAVGMFVWESAEGLRVEVPLGTDADALVARFRDGWV